MWIKVVLSLVAILAVRVVYVLLFPYHDVSQKTKRTADQTCHVALFLGSGGHTTEMLQLLSALPEQRYTPRTFIVASGDRFSVAKAQEPSQGMNADRLHFLTLPRARNVHQTWLSTPLTVLVTFLVCLKHIVGQPLGLVRTAEPRPAGAAKGKFCDLILMNGPGTCVPLVASLYVLRILGLPSPRLIYIESFARVRSLSLTAKILRFFVDRFVVQWNEGVRKGAHFRGWLV